jgi:hypothetical protein
MMGRERGSSLSEWKESALIIQYVQCKEGIMVKYGKLARLDAIKRDFN